MQPRTLLYAAAAVACRPALRMRSETVTLWHPFTLETDMIHGGIKAFNESQNEYRIDAAHRAGAADGDRADQGDRHRLGARPRDARQSGRARASRRRAR